MNARLLTPEQIAQTAASIASMQEADGAIPWTVGEHTDAWNHVEGAMALVVGGEIEAAGAAYDWCLRNQRVDGSWAMRIVGGEVEDGDLIYYIPWGNIGFYYNAAGIGYSDQTIHLGTYNASRGQLDQLDGRAVTIEVAR